MKDILQDLRFVIGAFFLLVALIVITAGLVLPPPAESPLNLNLGAGVVFLLFAVAMLAAALRNRSRSR